ncbi:protein tramtrack, beta isoform-like isoform X2 [Periplaneta americana]|uniref:protein tramtrack, beta isoform-like isoform X2 n=1 Tax=Periplaneta americana TaxID=6978 RepID=UPI0037E783A2
MGSDQQFCLRWHNYQSSLLASLPQLLDGDDLTDVTLSAGGRNLRAHRVVLSACSQYFKELFKVLQPLQHPVIVLPGTNFTDLCALVTFMYSGEVNIYQEQLPGLLNMADAMQIRGLAEVNGSAGKLGNNETAPSPKKETMSSAKRAKMSTHASVGPLLANQSPAADAKLPQTETVDIHGHFLKGKVSEYEIYGGTASRTTKQLNIENDLHYGNLQKESCPKTMAMSDSMDLYVENIPSKKSARGTVTKTEPEEGMRRSSPIMGLSTNIDNSTVGGNRVKIERDHNEGTGNTRISPDLAAVLKRATGIEDMELGSVENSAVQAQQSPSSEDSGGGNFGPDSAATAAATNRIHLSPGLSLTGCPSTPPSRQSVACPVCGRLISQRRNLSQHMRTHQMVLSDVNNHAEPAQVSVLPLDHVQARYGSRSRTTINHQTRPQHSMEEVVAPESSAGESIHGTVGMLSLDPSSQPHYS